MTAAVVVSGAITRDAGLTAPLAQSTSGRLLVDAGPGAGGALPNGTDRSGSITTGGTAQQMAPANSSRQSLTGQNISSGDLWINEIGGTAAVDTAGSYKVAAGVAFSIATNRAVSIIGATTGQKWTATET